MAGFKMNPNFEKELAKQVQGTMQREIDTVYRQYKGQPAATVKRALQARLKTALVEPMLSSAAEAISRGDKVNLKL
ncbi:hypothetical protein GS462_07810 [Rhodococcus hoagii]|nr:hypothetical protein [Prescottella equi]MBM4650322.1 hypothetical protein [Prescottella equi]MBM4683431.1 hypothetical protein [Prescottella equi]